MEEINLNELIKFFMSKIKILIIFVVLGILFGVIYITVILTPMYHSSTTLILVSSESNQNSTLVQSEVTLNKNLVTTYSEIVKSRSVLTQVIDKLALDMSVSQLSSKITVSSVENTEIIKIQVSDENNKLAKEIASTTASVFMKEVQKIYNLTNVSIVDEAYLEKTPYNVKPVKQMIIFTFGGLVIGSVIVFLIFYFDTTLKSANDIEEKLELAVTGNVILAGDKNKKKLKKGEVENKKELLVTNDPKSAFSESIKTIRTNLQFSLINSDIKTILITSPEPGDGKSFVAANLAAAFAQENKKVLLIDADLRKGRQSKIFNIYNDKSKGYSNLILSSKDDDSLNDFIEKTEVENLDLLTRGATPPNPSELLASTNHKELMDKLRSKYDIIILDCAPILGLNDTVVMTKLSDINAVVVSKRKTKLDTLDQTKKAFEKVNAKIDGVILNKVTRKENSYYGYYGEK